MRAHANRNTATSRITAATFAAAAILPGVVDSTLPAFAGQVQDVNNDYGQSPAQVSIEIAAQVNAVPQVKAALSAKNAAAAVVTAAAKKQAAARTAVIKAGKTGKKVKIVAAKKAYDKARKVTAAAQAKYRTATATYSSSYAAALVTIRAAHYLPVDGTYAGSPSTYTIVSAVNGVVIEPVQVQVVAYGGVVTDVQAIDYVDVGESKPYNDLAIPQLVLEAMHASKPSEVAAVAGATLTSRAFVKSLTSALTKAGFHI